jgi:hypothetical protein
MDTVSVRVAGKADVSRAGAGVSVLCLMLVAVEVKAVAMIEPVTEGEEAVADLEVDAGAREPLQVTGTLIHLAEYVWIGGHRIGTSNSGDPSTFGRSVMTGRKPSVGVAKVCVVSAMIFDGMR